MAEFDFNRELGVNPAGITRFGQIRTEDGDNVTIDSFETFEGDGSIALSDVFNLTYGSTGTATFILHPEYFGVSGYIVFNSAGDIVVEADVFKMTRRKPIEATLAVTAGDTATLYIKRTDRSATEYRLTVAVA